MHRIVFHLQRPVLVLAIAAAIVMAHPALAQETMSPLSFGYENGLPTTLTIGRYVARGSKSKPVLCSARTQTANVMPVEKEVYVYCSFGMGEVNPAPYADNQPAAYQTVTVGQTVEGKFVEALRFGMVDDDRASTKGQANYVPGVYDGKIEYYGMYARPRTPYDFKLKLDLVNKRATVWVAGRGDDEWFPLAIDAPLMNRISAIDTVRVDQLLKAPGIENLRVESKPLEPGEQVRPHPLAKQVREVAPGKGFTFQSMISLWREASRHVTVARRPNDDRGWWLGFPDLAQTGPKTLVCSYVDGQAHGGGGLWWVARSDDLGRTWRDTLSLGTGGAAMRLQSLRDGSLVMSEPGIFRSTDGGASWERVGQLNAKEAGGHSADVASRMVELADGSWLLVASYTPGAAWKVIDGETLEFYRSIDRGKTWKLHATIKPPYPLSLCEASIVPLPDGRLVVFARESGGFIPGVRAYSTDQGRTWSAVQELPFRVEGRTCAGLLKDGRVMLTFRSGAGPIGLRAWIGDADEPVRPLVQGIHFNDRHSVGLKNGALHLDNDGACGQFTKYVFRPPDSDASRIEANVEVMVVSNGGRAATLSVPFVGKLRIFPDCVQMAHDQTVRVSVAPNQFHTYRVLSQGGRMTLFVDGKESLTTDKLQRQVTPQAWSAQRLSPYALEFGNETATDASTPFDWLPASTATESPKNETEEGTPRPAFVRNITSAGTGYSIWKRFDARMEDPRTGVRTVSWNAASGEFPDQYQLDHFIEIDCTISGCDQGYSGWIQLLDGRLLVLNYTDDTARWNHDPEPAFGVPWIRGTYILPADLPPLSHRKPQ